MKPQYVEKPMRNKFEALNGYDENGEPVDKSEDISEMIEATNILLKFLTYRQEARKYEKYQHKLILAQVIFDIFWAFLLWRDNYAFASFLCIVYLHYGFLFKLPKVKNYRLRIFMTGVCNVFIAAYGHYVIASINAIIEVVNTYLSIKHHEINEKFISQL